MTDLVLDTSGIIPFTLSNNPVAARLQADHGLLSPGFRPLVSVVTLGELRAFARSWGASRLDKMNRLLGEFTAINLDHDEVLDAYAELHEATQKGLNIGQNDLWIAACARASGLPLLTSDRDLLRLPAGSVKLLLFDPKSGATTDRLP